MAITEELASRIGTLISILQALGAIVILYLVFGVINSVINGKRLKELEKINNNIKDLKKIMSKKK